MPDSEAETTAAQSHGVLETPRTGGRIKNQEREETASAGIGGLNRSVYKPCPSAQHEEELSPAQDNN